MVCRNMSDMSRTFYSTAGCRRRCNSLRYLRDTEQSHQNYRDIPHSIVAIRVCGIRANAYHMWCIGEIFSGLGGGKTFV